MPFATRYRIPQTTVDNQPIGFSPIKLAILQPAPLRKRLWQGGIALLAILLTFTIGNQFLSSDRSVGSRMLGHDFLAFCTAGTFARTGQFDRLYDLESARQTEHAIAAETKLEIGPSFGPYWNPPFYAWYLAPFSALPYRQALALWTLVNLSFLSIAVVMLARMLPEHCDWRSWALIPLLIVVCMSFVQAISHGQNTFMSLMLLTLTVTAWRKQMPLTAGLICGLLFYKPQLAAVIAGMLMLTTGLRAAIGVGIIACALLLLTNLTMPHVLADYLYQLPLNLKYMQVDHDYLWERHVTFRAFWRLLFQGREAAPTAAVVDLLTVLSSAVIGLGLLGSWWRLRRLAQDDRWTGETQFVGRDRLISATIIAMPLLMPFYFDYDLLLLAVPAVLLGAELSSRPDGTKLESSERMLVGSWIALYLWLMFNPGIAGAGGVNVSVVLLNCVCCFSIVRALQSGLIDAATPSKVPSDRSIELKRAA